MKRFILGLTLLLLLLGAPSGEAAEMLFTVNANDNSNQILKFAGYEFRFQHMDHRTYLYKDKNVNNGFQWTTSVITCWLKKEADPDTRYDLWQQFLFGGPITSVEPGQVYTKYTDGRNVQMLIEKVAYYTGYRATATVTGNGPATGTGWTEETLPKYITIRIIVN
jgi:hypothetical protein